MRERERKSKNRRESDRAAEKPHSAASEGGEELLDGGPIRGRENCGMRDA